MKDNLFKKSNKGRARRARRARNKFVVEIIFKNTIEFFVDKLYR